MAMIASGDDGMKLEMPMRVDMIERQPGCAIGLELRGDFSFDLPPHGRMKVICAP